MTPRDGNKLQRYVSIGNIPWGLSSATDEQIQTPLVFFGSSLLLATRFRVGFSILGVGDGRIKRCHLSESVSEAL